MIEEMKREFNFLCELGVPIKSIEILTKNEKSKQVIKKDLIKLKKIYKEMPKDIKSSIREFKTYLWTLLGEIGVSSNLGENIPEYWPIVLFPFSKLKEEVLLRNYIRSQGYTITKKEKIILSELLYTCLYGGQNWFNSLREAITKINAWEKEATLLWIKKENNVKCSIASMAKKTQLHLRPLMTTYEIKNNELKYPGILKAFHTPDLGNIEIHSLILNLEEWKC